MTAQAAGWDDVATIARPAASDDAWHVAIAPDEVKIVSLEQLDDMFRLSLVDSETKVWQAGMSEWLPLGVVAGIDEESAAPTKRAHAKPPSPRSAPPPTAPSSPRSAPPPPSAPAPQSVRPAPPAPRSAPPPPSAPPPQSVRPAPRSAPPPPRPPSRAPLPLPSTAALPPASSYPEPLAFTQTALAPQPGSGVASFAPTASVRPLSVSHAPANRVPQAGGVGRSVMGLAVVAGITITLYRNDLLRDAAHAIGQDALYTRLEEALGGPAFGTLRGLEQSTGGSPALTLANTVPAATSAAPSATEIAQASSGSSAPPVVSVESLKPEKSGAPLAKPAALAPKAPQAAAAKPAAPQKPDSEMTPRERLNAEIAHSMQSNSASSAKKKSSKGASDYDPLNPKL